MSDWVAPLRAELKARLIAAKTLAVERVFSEQMDPVYSEVDDLATKMPRVCIYTPEDDLKTNANATRWDTKSTIVIDCWSYGLAATGTTAEEAAGFMRDALAFQVLRATVGDDTWRKQFSAGMTGNVTRKTEKRQVTYGCARIILTVNQEICWDAAAPGTASPFERAVLDFPKNTLGGGPEGRTELTADIKVP